jgi:hypothetical protein
MVGEQLIFDTTRGREGLSAGWAGWLDAWQSHRSEIEELHVREVRDGRWSASTSSARTTTPRGRLSSRERRPEAVVCRLVELFNSLAENPEQRARSETLGQMLDHFAESVEFIQLRAQPDLRDVRGREDFSAAWAEWLNAWESQRSEIEEIHTRDNRVLVFSSAAWAAFNEAAPPNE